MNALLVHFLVYSLQHTLLRFPSKETGYCWAVSELKGFFLAEGTLCITEPRAEKEEGEEKHSSLCASHCSKYSAYIHQPDLYNNSTMMINIIPVLLMRSQEVRNSHKVAHIGSGNTRI